MKVEQIFRYYVPLLMNISEEDKNWCIYVDLDCCVIFDKPFGLLGKRHEFKNLFKAVAFLKISGFSVDDSFIPSVLMHLLHSLECMTTECISSGPGPGFIVFRISEGEKIRYLVMYRDGEITILMDDVNVVRRIFSTKNGLDDALQYLRFHGFTPDLSVILMEMLYS